MHTTASSSHPNSEGPTQAHTHSTHVPVSLTVGYWSCEPDMVCSGLVSSTVFKSPDQTVCSACVGRHGDNGCCARGCRDSCGHRKDTHRRRQSSGLARWREGSEWLRWRRTSCCCRSCFARRIHDSLRGLKIYGSFLDRRQLQRACARWHPLHRCQPTAPRGSACQNVKHAQRRGRAFNHRSSEQACRQTRAAYGRETAERRTGPLGRSLEPQYPALRGKYRQPPSSAQESRPREQPNRRPVCPRKWRQFRSTFYTPTDAPAECHASRDRFSR